MGAYWDRRRQGRRGLSLGKLDTQTDVCARKNTLRLLPGGSAGPARPSWKLTNAPPTKGQPARAMMNNNPWKYF